jgi:hypothetical protein
MEKGIFEKGTALFPLRKKRKEIVKEGRFFA